MQLLYANQFVVTRLNVGGGIDASQTTGIVIEDVSQVDTTKPGIVLINYADPVDTSIAEWVEYTSINGSKELVGVTRGAEGYSAKTHSNSVSVAFPVSESHINRIAEKLNGNDTGVVLDDAQLTGTPTFDSEALPVIYPGSMSRQAIMNGNFDVWQRGTSVATADVTSTFQADRWYDYPSKDGGTLPTLTRSRQLHTSGDIANSFYFSRLATNGAGTSLGVNSYHQYAQKIEHATRLLCGASKKVTVSYWARSSIAGKKIGLCLVQNYGTTGSPTSEEIITGTAQTLTSSWVKYTSTFTTNTLVGKTFGTDNNDSLRVIFNVMWGDTIGDAFGLTGAETYVGAGDIDIAQVQLCVGDVALPFQPKSYEEELGQCLRYYINLSSVWIGTAAAPSTIGLPTMMRSNVAAVDVTGGGAGFTLAGSNVGNNITFFQTTGAMTALTINKEL